MSEPRYFAATRQVHSERQRRWSTGAPVARPMNPPVVRCHELFPQRNQLIVLAFENCLTSEVFSFERFSCFETFRMACSSRNDPEFRRAAEAERCMGPSSSEPSSSSSSFSLASRDGEGRFPSVEGDGGSRAWCPSSAISRSMSRPVKGPEGAGDGVDMTAGEKSCLGKKLVFIFLYPSEQPHSKLSQQSRSPMRMRLTVLRWSDSRLAILRRGFPGSMEGMWANLSKPRESRVYTS